MELVATAAERGVDFVVCGLCRRQFRAVSNTHLVRAHGFDPEHPIRDYLEMFGLPSAECEETRRQQIDSVHETLERQGRRWTAERVCAEILRRIDRGQPVNARAVVEQHQQLMLAARDLHGSWDRALVAAGVDAEGVRLRRRWTREVILEEIRARHANGDGAGYGACNARGDGLAQAARREFGSWDSALREAGLDPSAIRQTRRWSDEDVLEAIRKYDVVPDSRELARSDPKLLGAARRRWGGWREAVEAAGRALQSAPPKQRKWSRETVLEGIRLRAAEGMTLRPKAVALECGGLWRAARREFGGWGDAVRAAGLEYAHQERRARSAPAVAPQDPLLLPWPLQTPGVA